MWREEASKYRYNELYRYSNAQAISANTDFIENIAEKIVHAAAMQFYFPYYYQALDII